MATLERIRRRSGLLLIVIGLAMLAFILTDLLSSGNSIFRGDATVVGRIDGRTVEYNEFAQMMREREASVRQQNPQQAASITNKQIADAVWDQMVREELMGEQYDELGISVNGEELYRRIIQNPTIRQAPAFQDESGNFSEMRLRQFIQQLQNGRNDNPQMAEQYTGWKQFEANIRQNALQTKYNTAVSSGLYMPDALAKTYYQSRNQSISAGFVALEYFSVPDSSITVTEDDLRSYYNENKDRFEAEESASLQYVNFPVAPAGRDREAVRQELMELMNGKIVEGDTLESLSRNDDDSSFAATYSDLRPGAIYYRADNLPNGLDSNIFNEDVGAIKGPYMNNGFYHLTKVMDKKTFPDSVKARHILLSFQGIQGSQAVRTFEEAKALSDSLVEVLRADTSQFATIAQQMSDDPGSGARGGDLGWFDEKTMVRPFSNYVYNNEVGDIGVVMSQFGFHIIEVLDQGGEEQGIKLVNISRQIEASEETRDSVYNAASTFAAAVNDPAEFSKIAQDRQLSPRQASNLKPFDESISGLGANRDIVKWAHNEEETEVGGIQLFNEQESYIVAVLTERNEDGHKSFEAVKNAIRPSVMQEKKAQQLIKKAEEAMNSSNDIQELANNLGTQVQPVNGNFPNNVLTQYGNEPKVIGVLSTIEPKTMSKPIEGRRAVYVVQVDSRSEAIELPNYGSQKQQVLQPMRNGVNSQLYLSLKEGAKVEDNRAKFY